MCIVKVVEASEVIGPKGIESVQHINFDHGLGHLVESAREPIGLGALSLERSLITAQISCSEKVTSSADRSSDDNPIACRSSLLDL